MLHVTDQSFERDILRSSLPVVVDFWAPWCAPCRTVSALLEALAESHTGRLCLAKLNVDENSVTASHYGVLALPTAILFAEGRARETVVGARSRRDYEKSFAAWLDPK